MDKDDDIKKRCQDMIKDGAPPESLVKMLREVGYSKVASLPILVSVMEISLAEAKMLVHNSTTWSDVRYRDEQFHNSCQLGETL